MPNEMWRHSVSGNRNLILIRKQCMLSIFLAPPRSEVKKEKKTFGIRGLPGPGRRRTDDVSAGWLVLRVKIKMRLPVKATQQKKNAIRPIRRETVKKKEMECRVAINRAMGSLLLPNNRTMKVRETEVAVVDEGPVNYSRLKRRWRWRSILPLPLGLFLSLGFVHTQWNSGVVFGPAGTKECDPYRLKRRASRSATTINGSGQTEFHESRSLLLSAWMAVAFVLRHKRRLIVSSVPFSGCLKPRRWFLAFCYFVRVNGDLAAFFFRSAHKFTDYYDLCAFYTFLSIFIFNALPLLLYSDRCIILMIVKRWYFMILMIIDTS